MSLFKCMSLAAALALLAVTAGCGSKKDQQAAGSPSQSGSAESVPVEPVETVAAEPLSLEEKLDVLEEAVQNPDTETETFAGQVALLAASTEAAAASDETRGRIRRLVLVAAQMQALQTQEAGAAAGGEEPADPFSAGAFAAGGDEAAAVAHTLALGEVSHD